MRLYLCVLLLCCACAPKTWIVEGCAVSTRPTYNGTAISASALEAAAISLGDYRTVLFNHEESRPVGKILSLTFKDDKLWVKIAITDPWVWDCIRSGILTGFSIRWFALDQELEWFDELNDGGILFTAIVIMEVSIVSVPANPDCRITRWYTER